MSERGAYRPKKAGEMDAIEARRIAVGLSVDELAAKAGMNRTTYFRMRKTGRGFTRRIKALQMALRTLEQEKRREGEIFPFAPPDRPAPLAEPGRGGSASGTGSATLALAGSGRK
jgi:hypothetical protein